MGGYKGTGAVFMRQYVRSFGAVSEQAFLAKLTPEETRVYHTALAISWVPIEVITKFFLTAAEVLIPQDPNGLKTIGIALAKDNVGGIYRILFRMATPAFLMEHAAKFWSTYHAEGQAHASVDVEHKRADYLVEGYPSLPERFRECMSGYIQGMMEMMGYQKVVVTKGDDPQTWKWIILWE